MRHALCSVVGVVFIGSFRDLDVWVGSLPGIARREAPDVDVAPLVALFEEHRQAALVDFRRLLVVLVARGYQPIRY